MFLRTNSNAKAYFSLDKSGEAIVRQTTTWRPMDNGQRGKPKSKWEDQVPTDTEKLKIQNTSALARQRRFGTAGKDNEEA